MIQPLKEFHGGIVQALRLLIAHLPCIFSKDSRKSMASPNPGGRMSNEWTNGINDSCWQGLLASGQPTPWPLPLLSTGRQTAVRTKITGNVGHTQMLVYKGTELGTHPVLLAAQPVTSCKWKDSPLSGYTHMVLPQRHNMTGAFSSCHPNLPVPSAWNRSPWDCPKDPL